MVKQGPCCHCGITMTPLWRNGPPEKPVLCNACGSRWRTKGTLANYMPMHSGGYTTKLEPTDKLPPGKLSQKSKGHRSYMRKQPYDVHADSNFGSQQSDCFYVKCFDEDTSTKSSIGSGLSYSEGSAQNIPIIRDFSVNRPLWNYRVPSKKRSQISRSSLSKEKLSQMHIFHHVHEPFMFNYFSEEDLLLDYKPPSMATEIGLGGVFIRPPLSLVQSDVHAHTDVIKHDLSMIHAPLVQNLKGTCRPLQFYDKARVEDLYTLVDNNSVKNKALLENCSHSVTALQSCLSLLNSSDLKDVVNFETYTKLLTDQEQRELLKYLSSADVPDNAEGLKDLFKSCQFETALTAFQHLLSKGWADQWIDVIGHRDAEVVHGKEKINGEGMPKMNLSSAAASLSSVQSQHGWNNNQYVPGAEESSSFGSSSWVIQNSPSSASPHSVLSEEWQRNIKANKEREMSKFSKNKGASKRRWSPISRSCCFSTSDISLSDQYGFLDAQPSESNLLLNAPSGMCFQQAELLQQPAWHKPQLTKEPETENEQDLISADSYIVNSAWGLEETPDFGKLLHSNSLPRERAHTT